MERVREDHIVIDCGRQRQLLKGQIQSVEVSYFVHATEDRAKVDGAVAALLGALGEKEAESVEGHFGNQIIMVKIHLTREGATFAVRNLFSKMPLQVKESLRRDLERHMDEHSALYLRLDKQKLLSNEVALSESDPVRVRIKPRLYALGGSAAQLYRGLLA
jgi:RNA binding exosome subunit